MSTNQGITKKGPKPGPFLLKAQLNLSADFRSYQKESINQP